MSDSNDVTITADNRGPNVNLVSWILLTFMCLACIIKTSSKFLLIRKLQLDDWYMIAATLVTVLFDGVNSILVAAGSGRHTSTLSPEEIMQYQQATLVVEILYVVSLGVAKMVVLHFLFSLAGSRLRHFIPSAVIVYSALLTVAAILALGFQCGGSTMVLSNNCFNRIAFWEAYAAFDILGDIVMTFLPLYLLFPIQMAWSSKGPIMVALGLRISLIPIVVVRLIYLKLASGSTDPTFDDLNATVTTIFHANLSVVSMAVPFLKPFMDSLQTGILAGDLRRLAPIRSSSIHWPYAGPLQRGKSPLERMRSSSTGRLRVASLGKSAFSVYHSSGQGFDKYVSADSEERMAIEQTKTVGVELEPL